MAFFPGIPAERLLVSGILVFGYICGMVPMDIDSPIFLRLAYNRTFYRCGYGLAFSVCIPPAIDRILQYPARPFRRKIPPFCFSLLFPGTVPDGELQPMVAVIAHRAINTALDLEGFE